MREFPSQYGRSEQYRNPEGTLPFPGAKEIPRPVWAQPRIGITFTGQIVGPIDLLPPGYLYTGTWESPWYDLRPDLRSSESQPKLGVPIWERNTRLYVVLSGSNNPFNPGYTVANKSATLTQFFEPVSLDPGQTVAAAPGGNAALPPPQQAVPSSVPLNVSSTFFPALPAPSFGLTSALGVFSPPGTFSGQGEGYPVRFWRVRLVFTIFVGNLNPVPPVPPLPPTEILQIQAAYY